MMVVMQKKNVSCATEHIYVQKYFVMKKCVRSTCVYNHIFVDLHKLWNVQPANTMLWLWTLEM